jgi:hypothetical protein
MVVIGAMYSKMDYVLSWQVRYAVWFDAFTPKFPSQCPCSDAESCGRRANAPTGLVYLLKTCSQVCSRRSVMSFGSLGMWKETRSA